MAGVDLGLVHPAPQRLLALATANTAAVVIGYSERWSNTSRTARASGSNFLGMTCILPTLNDAALNLGRFIPGPDQAVGRADGLCHESIETHLTIVFAALAIARHPERATRRPVPT